MFISFPKSFIGQFMMLSIFCIWLPSLFFWLIIPSGGYIATAIVSMIASISIAYIVLISLWQFRCYAQENMAQYTVLIWLFWVSIIWFILKSWCWPYTPVFFLCSVGLQLIYLLYLEFFVWKPEKKKIAYIPVGRATDMPEQVPSVQWVELSQPLLKQKVQGIVTDLHCNDLDKNWEKFIAEQTLQGIPVYHHRNIRESLTGRVRITNLYENELGSLLPSENYIFLKRIIGFLLVIFSLPVILPIMLITALFIKLESTGSILFTQKRVGQGGKEFVIYKFRSMCANSEAQGAKMASANDMRVTRVGKFIRKTRIDELPQFFNVLKGDMSLIGPRPEQKVFVEQFEQTIPFYNYRHIVKPGITGWAQVTQGYAGNEDETRIKVEYDFFYIKHFSFSLDLLIFFKTIRTMLTGFGAR